jgi:DNA-binding CsgD family transcriptional regulator
MGYMKTKSTVLTKEERAVLTLAALNGYHISNAKISQRLGISDNRVRMLIHQACLKLGAHNRNEAVISAMKWGEIRPTELYSLDELAEIFSSFQPDRLRRIANLVRRKKHGQPLEEDEQIICTDRRQDSILTQREREILILAGQGLTNKAIADKFCLTSGAARTGFGTLLTDAFLHVNLATCTWKMTKVKKDKKCPCRVKA